MLQILISCRWSGAPKQDRWMRRAARIRKAPVLIGVGAAFDMLAGTVRRAPRFLQRTGCEWMFRIVQEPRRLSKRYLESNSKFAVMLIGERLGLTKHQADA
jgi:N-acetylglucosaminyldiphosphoundecaprenol N-acetyl-beta-D-mannosaminyltransferase